MAKEQMQYADNPMMKLHFAQREKERESHLRERYIPRHRHKHIP